MATTIEVSSLKMYDASAGVWRELRNGKIYDASAGVWRDIKSGFQIYSASNDTWYKLKELVPPTIFVAVGDSDTHIFSTDNGATWQ